MPILVKDYTWEQSVSAVNISVPLKGAKASKVDILTTEKYVKAHYPPYYFECLLFAPIVYEESKVKIGDGVVLFSLKKFETEEWLNLHSPLSADKEYMKNARNEALERTQLLADEAAKKAAEAKREREKFSLNQALEIDKKKREYINNVKEQIKHDAHESMEKWKEEKRLEAMRDAEILRKLQEVGDAQVCDKKQDLIFKEKEKTPVRESGTIAVSFTARVFPTAARESTAADEEQWLRKNAEHKRRAEIEDANLTPQEKDPVYLRDKGNEFFKYGDYQAAINAYSHAIRLGSKMPALFSNRAACHLKLRNFFKCIEDASTALEQLTPPVPQNAASRFKAHVRRGTGFCHLELYVEGLMDYEAALKIDSSSDDLQADAERIREIIQGNSSLI